MNRYISSILVAFVLIVSPLNVGSAQCVETYVDNATFIVPSEAVPESFNGTETVTATTKGNNVCVAESIWEEDAEGFVLTIRGNDNVIDTNVVDGAKEGERFVLNSNGKSVITTLKDGGPPIQKTKTEYERGALYVASSFKELADDSSQIGFETDTLYTNQDSASVNVSVTLPDADTLTGVQFDIPFNGPKPSVSKGYDNGTLEANKVSEDTLRVLLYTFDSNNLPKQDVVTVTTEATTEGQTLNMEKAYATTGGANNTVEVDLNIGQAPLYIQQGSSDIIVQTESINHGETIAGNINTKNLTLENQGNVPADISMNVDNSLFTVPSTVSVEGDTSKDVEVMFEPTRVEFGEQSGNIGVYANDTTNVSVSGIGIGGRGDPSLDGTVNVSDVVKTADIILGEIEVNNNTKNAADVYPLADGGNGTVNISDLETTANAILNDEWGDGEVLIASINYPSLLKKSTNTETGGEVVIKEDSKKRKNIYVQGEDLRGVQLEIAGELKIKNHDNINLRTKKWGETRRIVAYRSDGPIDGPLLLAQARPESNIEVRRAVQSNDSYQSAAMSVRRVKDISANRLSVYPNPATKQATIELGLKNKTQGIIEVFNILGKRVAVVRRGKFEAGQEKFQISTSRYASGIYFVRFEGEGYVDKQKFSIVQ